MGGVGVRRVLMVSYFFPPINEIGSIRLQKFAKYLPEFGWEPWVLTLEEGLYPSVGTLPLEIPASRVVRAGLGWAARWRRRAGGPLAGAGDDCAPVRRAPWARALLTQPSPRFLAQYRSLPWVGPAVRAGTQLLQKRPFHALLSSHGPPASHIVAARLSRAFGLPWVADFRDLWAEDHFVGKRGLALALESRLERRVLRRAGYLVTVSEPLAERLRRLHGKTVSVVMNGFDEQEFAGLEPEEIRPGLRIVYTGRLYSGKQDPAPLFEAMRELRGAGTGSALPIEAHFHGADPGAVRPLAEQAGVGDAVVVHPRRPHEAALQAQVSADILLVLQWTDVRERGIVFAKIFEYLGARRPILALGPPGGVLEGILQDTGAGEMVSDRAGVMEFLEKWGRIKQACGTTRLEIPPERLEPYTRRHQTGVLAKVLHQVVDGCPAGLR